MLCLKSLWHEIVNSGSMLPLIKRFSISRKEQNGVFQSVRTIIVLLLVLSFQAAIAYVMVSSLP